MLIVNQCVYSKGVFNVVKAALPAMQATQGRGPGSIALVSSQASQVRLLYLLT